MEHKLPSHPTLVLGRSFHDTAQREYSELNGGSPKETATSQPLEIVDVTLFGKRVFVDVSKDPEMEITLDYPRGS